MTRNDGYLEALNASSIARRWSQLGFFKEVYALSLFPTPDTAADVKNDADILKEDEVPKNSDEYVKMRLLDLQLKKLIDLDIAEHLMKETGWERVKKIFEGGNTEPSQESYLALQTSFNTGCILFLVGGFLGSNAASQKFVSKNQHTAFETKFLAMRKYSDAVIFGGMSTGLKLALKAGFLTYLFMMSSQCIAAYRNKSSMWEYIAGGSLTCSLLRISNGWRGMVSGGVIGSIMGLIGGAAALSLLKLANFTQEERHVQRLTKYYLGKREFQQLDLEPQMVSDLEPSSIKENAVA